jgi:hypothetical protein
MMYSAYQFEKKHDISANRSDAIVCLALQSIFLVLYNDTNWR